MMIRKILIIVAAIFFVMLHFLAVGQETSKVSFVKEIDACSEQENAIVWKQHLRLLSLHHRWQSKCPLTAREDHWLNQIASEYEVKNADFSKESTWDLLEKRADVIPNSLTIAQAIMESDWGRSRFAKKANNYFGIHCYDKNCGLIPQMRDKDQSFEVKKYPNVYASVKDYMSKLNVKPAYQRVRDIRQQLRQQQKPLAGYDLASGLHYYSTNKFYIKSIQAIIKKYDLEKYDQSLNQMISS